jgi:exodeoxyribonuclease VII large subunit
VIGVVTSPSGAVIRDILHRLRDRFPRHVLIWPVAVQGAACAPEVARAIRGFNALPEGGPIPRPDVLIVARGGGSLEDLWGFNEEAVVRAAAESVIPLISAVGHETDTTLIDYASDRRAPTPTAAAEMAVPVRLDLLNWVRQQDGYMTRAARQGVATRRQRLGDLSRGLPRPEMLLEAPRQRLDRAVLQLGPALRQAAQVRRRQLDQLSRGSNRRWSARWRGGGWSSGAWRGSCALDTAKSKRRRAGSSGRVGAAWRPCAGDGLARRRDRLTSLERLHATLGYEATLRRGYAVVHADGHVATKVADAQAAARLEIEFIDGRLAVVPAEPAARPAPKRKTPPDSPPDQGTLF